MSTEIENEIQLSTVTTEKGLVFSADRMAGVQISAQVTLCQARGLPSAEWLVTDKDGIKEFKEVSLSEFVEAGVLIEANIKKIMKG